MSKRFFWKIWLRLNPFKDKAEDGEYMAEVSTMSRTPLRNEDLARRIVEARTEHHYETILSIINERDHIVQDALLRGYPVQDNNFHFLPRITGKWTGADTPFDPAQHRISIDATLTTPMRARLNHEVGVEVLGRKANGGAGISLVTDANTQRTDGYITPGDNLIIEGRKIKILPQGEPQGVYLVDDAGQAIPLEPPAVNYPRKIICRLPSQLPDGSYTLRIVTRFSSTNGLLLRLPRTLTYDLPLYGNTDG